MLIKLKTTKVKVMKMTEENSKYDDLMRPEGLVEQNIKEFIGQTASTLANNIYKDIEFLGETLHSKLSDINERIDRARGKLAIIHEAVEKNSQIIIAQLAELSVQIDTKNDLKKTERAVWFALGLSIGTVCFSISSLF